jgi:hypothetical protein
MRTSYDDGRIEGDVFDGIRRDVVYAVHGRRPFGVEEAAHGGRTLHDPTGNKKDPYRAEDEPKRVCVEAVVRPARQAG